MRLLLCALFVVFVTYANATTWAAAYPYRQHIEGQEVVIEAIPYNAYVGSPSGVTRVYFKNKLLYTIDKYYREKIFTSNDGQYFAIVHTTNMVGVTSTITMGHERIDYNQPAIEVYKNGILYKSFSLKDVIDTSRLRHEGFLFDWGYYANTEPYFDAQCGCEACLEVYGKKVLRNCDTAKISFDECEECKKQCDSIKLREAEVNLMNNSSYVSDNYLYTLSNQGFVVRFSFDFFSIEKLPFHEIIPDKLSFHPHKVIRKYKNVRLPGKFDLPDLKSGKTLDEAIAILFKLPQNGQKPIEIFISSLTINSDGICINPEITVSSEDPDNPENLIENTTMTATLIDWVKNQRFKTNLIPKGSDQYSFYSFITLK